MSEAFQITFDCANPTEMSHFWSAALGYKLEDPPPGYDNWEDWLQAQGVPEEEWNDASAAVDPEGVKPSLYFQKVPEGKVVKNRLHLDVRISGGPKTSPRERQQLIEPKVEKLLTLGATKLNVVEEHGSYWVVMADPEGNEFCIT